MRSFGLLIGGIALSCVSQWAAACSCVNSTAEQRFDQAQHVFVARIRSVEDIASAPMYVLARKRGEDWDPEPGRDYGLRARFVVEKRIKGDARLVDSLVTGYGGGDCGVDLRPGRTYVIATGHEGGVGICDFTRAFEVRGCDDVEMLASLVARASDGVTPLNLAAAENSGVFDATFDEALRAGAEPYELTPENCPRDSDR